MFIDSPAKKNVVIEISKCSTLLWIAFHIHIWYGYRHIEVLCMVEYNQLWKLPKTNFIFTVFG